MTYALIFTLEAEELAEKGWTPLRRQFGAVQGNQPKSRQNFGAI
ncbi:hypothetical protein [Noviherbaspirillum sedimenti]|nr:hypothetical protein [Noviherbaspirillum sedimenti]